MSRIQNCIYIQTSNQILENPIMCYKMLGEFRPYVGSSTAEKITKASIDVTEKTSFLKALIELGKIKTWLLLLNASSLVKIVDIFINEKLDLVALPDDASDVLDICSKIESGNILHRFKSQVEHSYAVLNCLAPVASHFNQSSNPMATRTAGGVDLSIFYQLVYISNMRTIVEYAKFTKSMAPFFAAIFECPTCTHVLPDTTFEVKDPNPTGISIPPCPQVVARAVSSAPPNIRSIMGYKVGRTFSDNIDSNYTIHHNSKHEGEIVVPKKDPVSLNDMRDLDTDMILCTAFMFSSHCQTIIAERENTIIALSFDQSFIFLAESLLNAGSLEKLFLALGGKVLHHNMVTTAKRLSGYISRFFKHYLLGKLEFIRDEVLSITIRDDVQPWKWKHAVHAYLALKKEKDPYYPYRRNKEALRGTTNVGLIKRRLRIPSVFCNIPPSNIISVWRGSDRGAGTYNPAIMSREVALSDDLKYIDIPGVISYHSYRSQRGGDISVQPLSFIARPLGRISSACNKYLEIILCLGLVSEIDEEFGCVYSIAEGSGGTLTALLAMFPHLSGAYNTLMRHHIDPRDTVTDCRPPAFVESGLNPDRLIFLRELAAGETDILTPAWLEKFKRCLDVSRPVVVTMDAESMNRTSNIEFAESLLPCILKSGPTLVIFKMFWTYDLTEHIKNIVPREYSFLFFKPISSNPIGNECFLIVIPSALRDRIQNWRSFERIWESSIGGPAGYLMRGSGMTEDQVTAYSKIANNIARGLQSIFSDCEMLMTNKYEAFIQEVGACGLICIKVLDQIMADIDKIANNVDSVSVYLAVREAGTNAVLWRMIHDIVFLVVYLGHKNESAGEIIGRLSYITIKENIGIVRANRSLNFLQMETVGKFWNTWGDAKMYCRYIRNDQRCSCEVTRVWSRNDEQISVSWRVVQSLSNLGWLQDNIRGIRVVDLREEE